MPRGIQQLTIGEVEYVAHRLAKEIITWDEPIPEFRTRFPNALESCLAVPFQRFGGRRLYSSLIDKAAILLYLMIKNHPFQNGNKRIAVTTLMLFLMKNRKWIRVDNQELFNFAKWVASSNPRLKDATVNAIRRFLQLYIIEQPVIRK